MFRWGSVQNFDRGSVYSFDRGRDFARPRNFTYCRGEIQQALPVVPDALQKSGNPC